MAGKAWQPSLGPYPEGRKWAPATLMKHWKEKEGSGEGKALLSRVPALETHMLEENADSIKLLGCLEAQEHEESRYIRRSKHC